METKSKEMKKSTFTKEQKQELGKIIIAAILFFVFLAVEHTTGIGRWGMFVLYLIPYLIVGLPVLCEAVEGIGHGQVFDEEFLMALATIGAFAVGESAEAVAVMVFYQVGEFFQDYAVDKSRDSISELMEMAPEYANLIGEDGNFAQVSPDEVETGSLLMVLPGEKIPIDGVVEEGESLINTVAITGESVPRSAREGSEVLSGCVNGEGTLRVRTTKRYEDSTVARVLELVENASEKKSKTENFITRFCRYYTPVVVIAAVILAVIPPLFLGNWRDWILRACTFLVISCPCAFVISVPLSFFGGIGAASKQGILVKGSNYLELLKEVGTLVTDKTGTLTRGVFEVQELFPAQENADEDSLLRAAAAAEQLSTHPIALSILQAFEKQFPEEEVPVLVTANNHSGKGIEAYTEDACILAGNARLMDVFAVPYKEAEDPAATVVYVASRKLEQGEDPGGTGAEGKNFEYLGALLIADEIKPEAKEAVAAMKQEGIEAVMLTGDRKEAAEAVAGKLGITQYHAELLPTDKVEIVEELLAAESAAEQSTEGGRPEKTGKSGKAGRVAFVGDGINDAPVLARADVGIAMGALGSDAAIEAADVVLMDDDLRKIPRAIQIAGKTVRIAKENIAFALIVKIVILILGACGIATMWAAVFADVGVTVIATLNAMRTMTFNTKDR